MGNKACLGYQLGFEGKLVCRPGKMLGFWGMKNADKSSCICSGYIFETLE